MGYQHKVNRLLGNSDKKMRDYVIAIWQKDKSEYNKLSKEFESSITELMIDYSREKFNKIIGTGFYEGAWKKITPKKKEKIIDELEPILFYGKKFSDHLAATGPDIKFIFLETPDRLVSYCNGMYSEFTRDENVPFNEDEKDFNQRIRVALRVPSTTIKCEELNKFAVENEKFPVLLSELTFLEPLLNKQQIKLKI
jgi:hypothetical protein